MTLENFIEAGKAELSAIYDQRELQNILFLIVEEKLGLRKFEISANSRKVLQIDKQIELEQIIERLLTHEPVQYILGEADFYGLKFKVNKHVLIPRPETEELVDIVIKECRSAGELNILDIGAGSGCIAVTIKKNLPGAALTAIDISKEALAVAKENARFHQVDVNFLLLDFLEIESWQHLERYDIIISNPPYITQKEFTKLDSRVSEFEPKMALIAEDGNPFIFYRKIADFGVGHLSQKGKMYVELNSENTHLISRFFSESNYSLLTVKEDMQGLERILKISK